MDLSFFFLLFAFSLHCQFCFHDETYHCLEFLSVTELGTTSVIERAQRKVINFLFNVINCLFNVFLTSSQVDLIDSSSRHGFGVNDEHIAAPIMASELMMNTGSSFYHGFKANDEHRDSSFHHAFEANDEHIDSSSCHGFRANDEHIDSSSDHGFGVNDEHI